LILLLFSMTSLLVLFMGSSAKLIMSGMLLSCPCRAPAAAAAAAAAPALGSIAAREAGVNGLLPAAYSRCCCCCLYLAAVAALLLQPAAYGSLLLLLLLPPAKTSAGRSAVHRLVVEAPVDKKSSRSSEEQ
jgi:hypothetical protein